eukprot:COSAG02_NODE_47293_length_342_cov_0.843621_1_plen_65_part_10
MFHASFGSDDTDSLLSCSGYTDKPSVVEAVTATNGALSTILHHFSLFVTHAILCMAQFVWLRIRV